MKRAIIIHGWGGSLERDFLPWAKKELEKKGYEVIVPNMPDTDNPKIGKWVPYLAQVVGEPRKDDIIIGHSIGCRTILRYLEILSDTQKIDRVILVAGFTTLTLDKNEDSEIAKPWLETPIDFEKVKARANSFIVLLSDDDPWVPLEENKKVIEEKLGAQVFVEHNKGHFNDMPQERPDLLKYF